MFKHNYMVDSVKEAMPTTANWRVILLLVVGGLSVPIVWGVVLVLSFLSG